MLPASFAGRAARRGCLACLALLAACGGTPTKTPTDEGARRREVDSIGALAAAQGGLASLGGGVNASASGFEAQLVGPLRAEKVDPGSPVKVDGVLKEWQARSAATPLRGETDGLAFAVALQYDDAKIYLAGEVTDPQLVRTARFAESEDHASLALAFPSAGGRYKAYEIGIFPGKVGETAGSVRYLSGPSRGREVAGAKVVEAPAAGGLTFEAAIPWATFPEAQTVRVGLRAAARYHDGDGAKERGVLSTGPGGEAAPGELLPLPTAAERAVVEGLLEPKGLARAVPRIDLITDVVGDAMKERVSVFDRFVTVCGPGYRGGNQFFYRELAGELTRVEARDLGGRGKDALLVRRRLDHGGVTHEAFEVWVFAKEEPEVVFSHEIAISSGAKRLANAVRVSRAEIEITVEPAEGWDATSYHAPPLGGDTQPLLAPWGPVKSRLFRFDGARFTKTSEVAQEAAVKPDATASAPTASVPRDVPTPPVAKGADLSARVYEQYLADQRVPPGTHPKVDLQVQVHGDPRPERIVVVGRDLVVLGPGYKGGTQYAFTRLSDFAAAEDIHEVTARDITGDGLAEVLVRGKVRLTPTVDSEVLLVYSAASDRVIRLLAVETARESGPSRVQGLVQFVPSRTPGAPRFDVDVRPGTSRGWTEQTCPFSEGELTSPGAPSVPVLLPWGKTKHLRMVWNGSTFARE